MPMDAVQSNAVPDNSSSDIRVWCAVARSAGSDARKRQAERLAKNPVYFATRGKGRSRTQWAISEEEFFDHLQKNGEEPSGKDR